MICGRNDRRRDVAIRSRSEMAGQSRNHDFFTPNCRILPTLAYALVRIKSESVYYLPYGIQNVFQTSREKTESLCTG